MPLRKVPKPKPPRGTIFINPVGPSTDVFLMWTDADLMALHEFAQEISADDRVSRRFLSSNRLPAYNLTKPEWEQAREAGATITGIQESWKKHGEGR